jgi:class 3 adenylate cyclase
LSYLIGPSRGTDLTLRLREDSPMARNALCPVLIRRDDELAVLEDALLAARRGESRFVAVAGEAGIGKTRLAGELAHEARELGCIVLAGACSDAELTLPYLPFVEAIGNYLDEADTDRLRDALGPGISELAQLFPRLSHGAPPEHSPDPGQAKLRLFEAVVSLLALPARESTLMLVIEDVHWADASTRELLDYLARRLTDLPSLILVTYRRDELNRRHPLMPVLQGWRRSGLADVVELEQLSPDGVGEMLAATLGEDAVDAELRELMVERSEGNPFVLEEMLREVVEGSGERGAARREFSSTRLPETVRHAILLRVQRLGDDQVALLETAAILGRSFDADTLLTVSGESEATVHAALDAAITQQLLEEDPSRPGRYRWRHALTQEAIYTDTVTPRRQAIHSRAADALGGSEATHPVELANHLLGAARFEEAVPVCLRGAEEAEGTLAFGEAVSILERVLPYVSDPLENARVLCRIGGDHQRNGEPATAVGYLTSGIDVLEERGEELEAAHHRLILGRCHWESQNPDAARAEYERALEVLEAAGPSADLAMAHQRLAGMHAFELNYRGCLESARRAVEIAEEVGADYERVWALGFVSLGYIDGTEQKRGLELMDACFREAREQGYSQIASNVAWNSIWTRTHMMLPELEDWLERLESLPFYARFGRRSGDLLCRCYVATARGELETALADGEAAARHHQRLGFGKMEWRARIHTAQILAELGRGDAAADMLPPTSSRTELQDIVYDAAARIRVPQSLGRPEDALEVAEEIAENAERIATYRETLALGAQVLAVFGRHDQVESLAAAARAHPTQAGSAYLDEIDGLLALAAGDGERAAESFDVVVRSAADAGYPLVELRARTERARAWAATGRSEEAAGELRTLVEEAERRSALLIAREAREAADGLGVELPPAPAPVAEPPAEPFVPHGERLVTSLFADVRGYSELSSSLPPDALSERMRMLYRLARVTVQRRQGIVDKFAGDAVMATFNVSGARLDHAADALEAALTLRDKAALIDLPLGIGISVGPGILGRGASEENVAVRGESTNLAARLQAAAGPGEILLSAEAHRRLAELLEERGLETTQEELDLKGFDEPQVAHRILAPEEAAVSA